MQIKAAVIMALTQWEPRINIQLIRIEPSANQQGRFTLTLESERADTGEITTFEIGL